MNMNGTTDKGQDCQIYRNVKLKDSTIGNSCIIGDDSRVYDSLLLDNVRVDRNNLIIHSKIGDYSYTGPFTVIMHSQIGKFCSISWGVTIGAGEHDHSKITTHDFLYNIGYDLNNGEVAYDRFEKKMLIGNDVWIGTNATIVRGVSVGNGAVIGANSVVTKDIPPYAIVAGCPAKVIKYRFSEDIVERLQALKWWDLPSVEIKNKFKLFASNDVESSLSELEADIKI